MMDEDKTDWLSMFQIGTTYGFEGSDYTADDYGMAPDEMTYGTITYDSSVKLSGSKSYKANVTAATKTGAGLYHVVNGYDYYVRFYTRYVSAGTWKWPDSYMKMLTTMGPDQRYLQPNMPGDGTTYPSQITLQYEGTPHNYNVSNWLQDGRWYCIEARFKTNATTNFTAWVDGVQVASLNGISDTGLQQFIQFGPINMCCQGSGFNLSEWVDNYTVSTSRVYPSSVIEIGNNPDHTVATKVYQEPISFSDDSIQIRVDLTGLGAGPYYLWVTNNKQELSEAYDLSEEAPAVATTNVTGATLTGATIQ